MRNVRCKGNLDIDSAFALGQKKTVIESVGRWAFRMQIDLSPQSGFPVESELA